MIYTSAVVGLGNIGLGYDLGHKKGHVLTHTGAYLKHKNFRLLFGVDGHDDKRKDFQKKTRAPAFGSAEEALKKYGSVDAVSLCVPPGRRMELLEQIVKFHPRVILMEKPLAEDIPAAKRTMALCKRHGIGICVNYIRRFDKGTLALKRIIEDRVLGDVSHVDIFYNGGLRNNASHFIDTLLFLFGKPGSVDTVAKKGSGGDYDADFFLYYPGFYAFFKSVAVDCPVAEIHLWFDKGKIEYRRFGFGIDVYGLKDDPVYKGYKELAMNKTMPSGLSTAMRNFMDSVYEYLSKGAPVVSNGETALETLKICEDILKAN